ncbi:MFS transporter [Candidatus Peribacteria bacterium]|nr:MAG: MFS transporter [Candidatus Peribacteria bacterium]
MKRTPLFAVLLTIFIDLVGIGILFPVVPQLLANPDSPQYLLSSAMTLEQGYLLLGILTASYPIAQFLAAPILGQLSDKFGRRPVLMISLTGTCIGYILFAIAIYTRNLPLLFASRVLDGITGGNISVAQAAIADISTPESRSKNFGLMGAAFGLGFIIGPYIGGQLADTSNGIWFNAATPFWFAAFLSLINILFIAFFLPETNDQRKPGKLRWGKSFQDIINAVRMKDLRWLFIVAFFYTSGFAFFTSLFGVFLIDRFGFDEAAIGNVFAYIGIWIVITQGFLTPLVAKRWKEHAVVRVGMIGTGVAVLLFLAPGPWMVMLAVVPVFAIFNGITQANFMGLISRSAPDTIQGEVLGINASVQALAQALPPVASGYIASQFAPSATLMIASAIVVASGIMFILTVGQRKVG